MDGNKKLTIVTHSSGFHTDDIFAVATLFLVLEKTHDLTVVRSREKSIVDAGDYVVDVGSIYDPEKNRFDHHQQGGAGVRENNIPYASFGLVWKKYGEQLAGGLEAASRVDKLIVQPIDANDNGVQFLESKLNNMRPFDVGFLTSMFAPTWKEDLFSMDDVFKRLVSYAKVVIAREIVCIRDELEAEVLVAAAYNSSVDKRLIMIENSRHPWGEVLSKLPEPIYVVYENQTDHTWSVKGVRSDMMSYALRKKLPESWAGKSGEELEKVTGVVGSVFCHRARFMAVAKTKEAILEFAKIALAS